MKKAIIDHIVGLCEMWNKASTDRCARADTCYKENNFLKFRGETLSMRDESVFLEWLFSIIRFSGGSDDDLRLWAWKNQLRAMEALERDCLNVGLASILSGNCVQAIADFNEGLSICPWSNKLKYNLEMAMLMVE